MNEPKIVFFGDSITAGFNLSEQHENIVNLGVSGDKTINLIGRFVSVLNERPERLFIMIGTNDYLVMKRLWQDPVIIDYEVMIEALITLIHDNLPSCEVHFISIPPIALSEPYDNVQMNQDIDRWNAWLRETATTNGFTYIDVATALKDEHNRFRKDYTTDGVHFSEAGYRTYYDLVKPYFKRG